MPRIAKVMKIPMSDFVPMGRPLEIAPEGAEEVPELVGITKVVVDDVDVASDDSELVRELETDDSVVLGCVLLVDIGLDEMRRDDELGVLVELSTLEDEETPVEE